MNWTQLLAIGVKLAVWGLSGEADFDGIEDVSSDGMDALTGDLPEMEAIPEASGSVDGTGTPWFANIVDETKADIARIEAGTWTEADNTTLDSDLSNVRAALGSEQALLHTTEAHYDALHADQVRSAQANLYHALSLANDAQSNFESAVYSGDTNAIRSAAGQLGSANESVELAASRLDAVEST